MTVAVLGNNVAALVATHRLAEQGVDTHLISPSPCFGAHFAGMTIDGEHFDLGMVLLEFTSFSANPDAEISSYRADLRGDSGRFCDHIRRFVESDLGIETQRVKTPSMVLGGEWWADLIISNELSVLQGLDPSIVGRMRDDLAGCMAHGHDELHAAAKQRWSVAGGLDLEVVSRRNHGDTFHRMFIDGLCQKITGVPCSAVAARLHRGAWLPLYYPETLSASLAGAPIALPPTEFRAPRHESVGVVVERLVEAVQAAASVDVTIDTLAALVPTDCGMQVELQSGRTLAVEDVVWALPPPSGGEQEAPSEEMIEERASIGFGFVLVDSADVRRDFSTVHIVDDDYAPYRITNQTANTGVTTPRTKLIVEYNLDAMKTRSIDSPAALAQEIRRTLDGVGIVSPDASDVMIHVREFERVLPLPTIANEKLHAERERRRGALHPCLSLVGGAAPFGSMSLNDQIVQGLQVGEILSRKQEASAHVG